MLYYNTIDAKTLGLLKSIQKISIFENLRLVGGTSMALQVGHRISVYLDLFGKLSADRLEILNELNKIAETKTLHYTNNINIFIINGIKVDIVNYPYDWLKDDLIEGEIRLAKLEDIAAMKLSAITGRGTKKVFVDISWLLKRFSLKQMLQFYSLKYPDGSEFLVLKSLAYFDDAEEDAMPKMIHDANWEDIKKEISIVLKKYCKV